MTIRRKSAVLIAFFIGIASASKLPAQKVDPYLNDPEWYKPGHPLNPAEPASIETLDEFRVEKVLDVPSGVGSISAMTTDPEGNLIVAMQHRPGIYRAMPAKIGEKGGTVLERLEGEAESIGWSQGLLWAFDSLYVTVAEKNDHYPSGLYRLMDTNGDGVFDLTKMLFQFRGSGEHGPHDLVLGPDGDSLYMICGNGTPVPESIVEKRTLTVSGKDHLLPPGFGISEFTDAGWVFRFEPDGSNPELVAGGLRNSYDLAFNRDGELFIFDSDMEYDLGVPWYRPTRICHIVSGGEFGWRASAAKWPEWYADSVDPVVNVGPASPTGVLFGYETAFPARYRNAFFVLDWTYATIYAIHLTEDGAGYSGEVERFASGIGLPLTDIVSRPDGALYVSVGGRRLGSAIYRIWYEGNEKVPAEKATPMSLAQNRSLELRREIETLHGKVDTGIVQKIWLHLGNADKQIRYAARVALEGQPLNGWSHRAMNEPNRLRRLTSFVALARQGSNQDLQRLLVFLETQDWNALDEETLLLALRVVEIALARGENEVREQGADAVRSLVPLLPHRSAKVNREAGRVLCYVGNSAAIDPLLDLMESDQGDVSVGGFDLVGRNLKYASPLLNMAEAPPLVDRMHFAQVLNWIEAGWSFEQRQRYFRLVVEAMQTSKGGNGYIPFWQKTLDTARSSLTTKERDLLASEWVVLESIEAVPEPEGPGRIWEMDYLVDHIGKGFGSRDFLNGRKMFTAASCMTCHGMGGEGGLIGPDLTSIGQRFTVKDLLDSIIHPSKAISDQYQMTIFTLEGGEIVSGRVLSQDASRVVILPNAMNPSESRSIANAEIASMNPLPASTMPPGLLNALNKEEVLDLVAYLVAGANPDHPVFKGGTH